MLSDRIDAVAFENRLVELQRVLSVEFRSSIPKIADSDVASIRADVDALRAVAAEHAEAIARFENAIVSAATSENERRILVLRDEMRAEVEGAADALRSQLAILVDAKSK